MSKTKVLKNVEDGMYKVRQVLQSGERHCLSFSPKCRCLFDQCLLFGNRTGRGLSVNKQLHFEELRCNLIIWQQNRAPPHYSLNVGDFLCELHRTGRKKSNYGVACQVLALNSV